MPNCTYSYRYNPEDDIYIIYNQGGPKKYKP